MMEQRHKETITRLTLNEWLMKPKSIKVVVIDPFKHEIEEKYMDGTLQSIYDLIDCELFEVIRIDGFTELYVDEEARMYGKAMMDDMKHGFMIRPFTYPIFGRALVVGTPDKKGEMTGTHLTAAGVRMMLSHWVKYK